MKRIVLLVLSLALLVSLSACGGKNNGGEVQLDDKNAIKIGCYMPLTGSNAGSGECEVRGIQMAIDEVNAAGGINGRKVILVTYDSTGTTEGATKAATRLIEEDKVNVIAGSFLSSSVLAVSDITEKAHVLHVGTGTGATWTGIGLDYTYRATANGNLPVETMADELVECGMNSIALLSVASEYGQSGHDAVLAACKDRNIEVKADVIYQTGDTDFTGAITKILNAKADTVALYGLGNEMALIIKQLRQNGYEDLVFTIEGGANSEMFTVAGSASNGLAFAAAYVVPASPEEAATEMMKNLLEKYKKDFKEMPYSDVFYRGYDQGRLILEAMQHAENIDDGESIMKAFRAISGMELLGGNFDFTSGTGDGLTQANKWMILDGKIQVFSKDALASWRNK